MSPILKPGDLIAGKYRVERVLGEGAMGVVLLAEHLQLAEWVAIKVPLPQVLEQPENAARFLREARAAVRIKSEYVARVSDVGMLDSGEPFMVMEYLEGQDLATWLAERGPLPIEQAVEFVVQVCEALADAHSLGIVHRDLKPANLFSIRRSDGVLAIKVLDFGISKMISGVPEGAMTGAGTLMGSPFYMSPEQMISSSSVDARTDIWSLGVILFELVAKRPPFLADSLVSLGLQIAQAAPPRLGSLRTEVPPQLEAVIERCLAKKRVDRFANVAELAQALLPFAPARAASSVDRTVRIIQAASLSAQSGSANSSGAHARVDELNATLPSSSDEGVANGPHTVPLNNSPAGAVVGASSAPSAEEPPARPSLRRKRWVIGVAGAVVFGTGLGVLPMLERAPESPSPLGQAGTPSLAVEVREARANPTPSAGPIASSPAPPSSESVSPAPSVRPLPSASPARPKLASSGQPTRRVPSASKGLPRGSSSLVSALVEQIDANAASKLVQNASAPTAEAPGTAPPSDPVPTARPTLNKLIETRH